MAEKCRSLLAVFLATALVLAPARAAWADGDCPNDAARDGEGCARPMVRLGRSYQSTARFAEAAEIYERFATLYPREPEAPSALTDAVILRLGLGDAATATKDIARFRDTWGAARRTESAQLELVLAMHHAEHGERDRARATVRGAMDRLDHAPIDLAIRAHALAASLAETPLGAHEEHAKVLAAWNDPEAAEAALRRAWPAESEGQLDRRLARVLNAVGAARIFVADERRHAEVESVRLPAYAGAIEHGALSAYARGALREWFVKKRAAIERVEPEYMKVLDIKPLPPPASVIAAGAAVGAMWGELADDFRRVPMPAAWKKEPALHKDYFDALEAMSEPIRTRFAKPAMKKCLDLSIKYVYADASSRACEAWLVSHYKAEFPAVDELIPGFRQPSGPASALLRPDPPLREPSPPPGR
jgi:tetratricopeptide (TPR) repeat protein